MNSFQEKFERLETEDYHGNEHTSLAFLKIGSRLLSYYFANVGLLHASMKYLFAYDHLNLKFLQIGNNSY